MGTPRTEPTSTPTTMQAEARPEAAEIAALAELIKRKAAAAPAGADLGHAVWDLLAVAASFYGPEVSNLERHAALADAGLLANDNGTVSTTGRGVA